MDRVIDSSLTLEQALAGQKFPADIERALAIIDIDHISFDGKIHRGQLVVHKKVARELDEIFQKILELKFPIAKMIPIVAYRWSDEDSMADNNSSAFNYRLVYGTDQLSNHSFGLAIDINPTLNPYVAIDGTVLPPGATYNPKRAGTLTSKGNIVPLFSAYGWEWGGTWERNDWQHFQKK